MNQGWEPPAPWATTPTISIAQTTVGRRPRHSTLVRVVGWILVVATIVALAGGVAGIVLSRRADDRAKHLNAIGARLDRDAKTLATVIETTNHRADAPIGKSEQVANALSRIDEVAGNVFVEANQVEAALGEAVGRENSGGPGSGRSIYDGTAADSVRRLQAVLQGAQLTLAAAEQAALELRTSAS